MTPPPPHAHAVTVAGAAGSSRAASPVCPECGCPSNADRPPAAFAPRWPRLAPRFALLLTAAIVLIATLFSPGTRGGSMGYGGFNLQQWPSPPVSELREIAAGTRDGSALTSAAMVAIADFRQKWHTDSTLCLQAVAPTRWGYWCEDGVGWPMAWWWHIAYPDDGKTGRRYTTGARWENSTFMIPWFETATGTEHACHIHLFNIFLSLWCAAATWLIACRLLRRTMRPVERWVVLGVVLLVMLKLLSTPGDGWGNVRSDYVALERWPDPQSPLRGPELSLPAVEAAAIEDPTGKRLATELLTGTTDPNNPLVCWSLIPMTRSWGSTVQRTYGWPWPLIETHQTINPAPLIGPPNTKPVDTHFAWWRGPQFYWGTTGFPSSNTSLSLPLGSIALHTTLLFGALWCTRFVCTRWAARLWRSRFREGLCVACAYPVNPPVLASAPHPPTSPVPLRTPR